MNALKWDHEGYCMSLEWCMSAMDAFYYFESEGVYLVSALDCHEALTDDVLIWDAYDVLRVGLRERKLI